MSQSPRVCRASGRVCSWGGWVVSETTPVPSDPSQYAHSGAPDVVGCNRLTCGVCGGAVSQRVGGAGRIYSCACTTHEAYTRRTTSERDLDPGEKALPWRCAGHPGPSLPVNVDGLVVDSETDLDAVVVRALERWTPEGAAVNAGGTPSGWLGRLYSLLEGLPQGDAVGRAMGEAVGRPADRGTALRFYASHPRAPGFEAVLDIPGHEWGTGWPTPSFDRTWQGTPIKAIVARLGATPEDGPDALDRRTADLVREQLQAKNSAADSDWFTGLGAVDPKALLAEAPGYARLRGAYVGMMLDGLVDSDRADLTLVLGYALIDARAGRPQLKKWVAKPQHRRRSYAVLLQRRLDAPRKKK